MLVALCFPRTFVNTKAQPPKVQKRRVACLTFSRLKEGIAKRLIENMKRRHATWIAHVAQPSYSAFYLEIGDFSLKRHTLLRTSTDVATRPWRTPPSRAAGPGLLGPREYVEEQTFLKVASIIPNSIPSHKPICKIVWNYGIVETAISQCGIPEGITEAMNNPALGIYIIPQFHNIHTFPGQPPDA